VNGVDRRKIAGDSFVFSLVNAFAVVSTTTLNLSIAIKFGVDYQADAFFLAYALPGVLVGAMATAMRVVLVPTLVHLEERHRSTTAYRLISTICVVGLALWLVVALFGVIGGPFYIKLLAPSLPAAAQQIAAQISQWIFIVVPLTWLAEFLRAQLNAQQRFILPLVGESLANIVAVGLVLGLGKHSGIMIVGLGFITRGLIQIIVSASGLGLTLLDMRPTTVSSHRHEIWSVLRGVAIRLTGSLLRQSSITIERFWSAPLGIGAVSALSYAQMGTNVQSNIFSTGVATVLLPKLSRTVSARKQREEHRGTMTDVLRLALFLTAPVAAFNIIFSYPLCQIILASSNTSPELVILTSRLLAIYALRIPTFAWLSVLLTPFYALEDIWTPVKHMLLMLGINLVLDMLLVQAMNVYGFPIAAVLTDILSIARAFWLQGRLDVRCSFPRLRRELTIILTSTGIATVFALVVRYYGIYIAQTKGLGQLVNIGIAAISGTIVYFAASYLAGIPEARLVTAMLRLRIKL